jgi:hypothetical protein
MRADSRTSERNVFAMKILTRTEGRFPLDASLDSLVENTGSNDQSGLSLKG